MSASIDTLQPTQRVHYLEGLMRGKWQQTWLPVGTRLTDADLTSDCPDANPASPSPVEAGAPDELELIA